MANRNVLVAAVQLNSQAELAANTAVCEERIAEAAARGAEVVLLPENFAYFGGEGSRSSVAESLAGGGPILACLRGAARRSRVTVVGGGFPEISGDPKRPYNTCVVIDPAGQVIGAYRKLHLFDVELPGGVRFDESMATTPGEATDAAVVVSCAGLRVGISICYDLRFPELYRQLALAGAEVIMVPSAFTAQTGRDHWHVLLRARAIENQAWIVAANQWGSHPGGRRCFGHSLLVDPWGEVVAECEDGVGMALARVNLDLLAEIRSRLPCLSHRKL